MRRQKKKKIKQRKYFRPIWFYWITDNCMFIDIHTATAPALILKHQNQKKIYFWYPILSNFTNHFTFIKMYESSNYKWKKKKNKFFKFKDWRMHFIYEKIYLHCKLYSHLTKNNKIEHIVTLLHALLWVLLVAKCQNFCPSFKNIL